MTIVLSILATILFGVALLGAGLFLFFGWPALVFSLGVAVIAIGVLGAASPSFLEQEQNRHDHQRHRQS